jgi:dolichol kinase
VSEEVGRDQDEALETAREMARLQGLVARTAGLQPWRRAFHAANGVAVASALVWWPFSHAAALGALTGIVVALLAFDALRLRITAANVLFFKLFVRLASPREARRIASSTWYMMGIALAVLVAPGTMAVSGILVMALADPAASYFGRRWGRHPYLGGTVEGSAVFLLVALAVLLPRHAAPVAVVVAVMATVLERRSWPLDDNLAVPVGCALLLRLMESWV